MLCLPILASMSISLSLLFFCINYIVICSLYELIVLVLWTLMLMSWMPVDSPIVSSHGFIFVIDSVKKDWLWVILATRNRNRGFSFASNDAIQPAWETRKSLSGR